MKKLISLILFCSFLIHSHAQEKNFNLLPTIGATTPLLDNGVGYHLGLNPSFRLLKKLSIEGQISYAVTSVSGTFISGDTGSVKSFNALIGIRQYLNSSDAKTRFFMSHLVGINVMGQTINSVATPRDSSFGFSIGAFLEFNSLVAGLAFEAPDNWVFKLGYSF